MAAVSRLVSVFALWHSQRLGCGRDNHIRAFDKIRANVVALAAPYFFAVVFINAFVRASKAAKPIMTTWTWALPRASLIPCKGAMGEMDFQTKPLKQRIPQRAYLFALADRIGGNKPDNNSGALNVFRGFAIPAGDVVQNAGSVCFAPDDLHVLRLVRRSSNVFRQTADCRGRRRILPEAGSFSNRGGARWRKRCAGNF